MIQNVRFENSDSITMEDENRLFSFRELFRKRYSHPMFKKYYHLKNVSSVMIIILLIVIVVLMISSKNHSNDNDFSWSLFKSFFDVNLPVFDKNGSESKSHKLYICDSNQIRIYDLETDKSDLFHEAEEEIQSFDVLESSTYLTEKSFPTIQSINGSNLNVSFSKRMEPQALAVDYLTKKFYIVDKSAGTVNVMDFEGKLFGVVLSDLADPDGIVLDVETGLMFIVQQYKSVLRANMDGTELREVVKNAQVSTLTIDRKGKRIFWYDDSFGILTANYDGKNRTVLMPSHVIPVKSLAFHENYLFFVHPSGYGSGNIKVHASLWSCKIEKDICEDPMMYPNLFHDPRSIKFPADYNSSIENPCGTNNGDCSDFCLLTSNELRKSCACRTGYRLAADSQTCEPVRDFVLYVKKRYVRAVALDSKPNDTFGNAVVPVPLSNKSWFSAKTFHYDAKNDDFYFYDWYDEAIKVVKIMNYSDTEVLMSDVHDVEGISYDHASSNLYYTDDEFLSVVHFKRNGFLKKNLFTRSDSFGANNLNIDPYQGRVVFQDNSEFRVMNLDGSDLRSLQVVGKSSYSHILTMDTEDKAIYVFYNGEVYAIPYESSDVTIKYELPIQRVNSISVYGNYLIVFCDTGIWRMDKRSGENFTQIFSNHDDKVTGVKVAESQMIDGVSMTEPASNCEVNNGDCEQFCFSKPEKTCACLDTYWLGGNGRCTKNKK